MGEPRPSTSFDKLGAFRAVLQGRLQLSGAPRVSVKAQLLILASLISLTGDDGVIPADEAPTVGDFCLWHRLDEREVRGAMKTLAAAALIQVRSSPGTASTFTVLWPFPNVAEQTPRATSTDWSRAACPEVYKRDGNTCRYCGSDKKIGFDHVTPRSRGGDDSVENLVLACGSCNSHKGQRTPAEAGMALLPPQGSTA